MARSHCKFEKQTDNITYICTICHIPWVDKYGLGFAPPRNCIYITEEEQESVRKQYEKHLKEQQKRETIMDTGISKTKFPGLKQRFYSYKEEHEKWVAANNPLRKPEKILEIYDRCCKDCIHHRLYACDICGCFVNKNTNGIFPNKIAWATTRCPKDKIGEEPCWLEEVNYQPVQAIISPPKTGGCGCGH